MCRRCPTSRQVFCCQWVVRHLQHVATVIAVGSPNYPEDECTPILWNPRISSALPLWDPQTSQQSVFMVLVYCLVPQDLAAVVQDWTHSLSLLPPACIVVSHIAAGKKGLSNAACLRFWWPCQQINMCDSQILGGKFAKLQTHPVHTVCHC